MVKQASKSLEAKVIIDTVMWSKTYRGVQGSATDFLICAVAFRKSWLIFTDDDDFTHFKKWIPIKLYPFSPAP